MIYSRWDSVRGDYDIFETSVHLAAINDDLPVPSMPKAVQGGGGEIGIPSVECGRKLPAGAKHIGRSEFAEGHITPPSYVKLGQTETTAKQGGMDLLSFLAGAAVAFSVGWLLWRKR